MSYDQLGRLTSYTPPVATEQVPTVPGVSAPESTYLFSEAGDASERLRLVTRDMRHAEEQISERESLAHGIERIQRRCALDGSLRLLE